MEYGCSREGDTVTLRISVEQHQFLLLILTYALGAALGRGQNARPYFELVNAIERGNPNFTPYEIREDMR